MPQHAEKIGDILKYIRTLQPRDAVRKLLSKDSILLDQSQAGLVGVETNLSGDVWVRVRRQGTSPAPEFPQTLTSWATPIRQGVIESLGSGWDETDYENKKDAWEKYQQSVSEWRIKEAGKLKVNELYGRLLTAYRDLKMDGGAETMEVVCGIGMAHWNSSTGLIQHPVLIQACEIILNESRDGVIEIHPASAIASMHVGMFSEEVVEGSVGLDAWWNSSKSSHEITPFDHDGIDPIMNEVIARVDSLGTYVGALAGTQPGQNLVIDGSWRFFIRKRPTNRILHDIAALEKSLETTKVLPDALMDVVDQDHHRDLPEKLPSYRGLETVGSITPGETPRELYFPLPYNDEQVSIIQKLDAGHGVVVQGPPGTGKSHTIANIICHFLAEGKSVLVSAASAGALEVIREKIPESVRALTAALLSSDAESIKQFEQSISTIVETVSNIDPKNAEDEIDRKQIELDRMHQNIQSIDGELGAIADRHFGEFLICGEKIRAVSLIKMASDTSRGEFSLLIGENLKNIEPSLVDGIIEEIGQLRLMLGALVGDEDANGTLPPDLPAAEDLLEYVTFGGHVRRLSQELERGVSKVIQIKNSEAEILLEKAQSDTAKMLSIEHYLSERADINSQWNSQSFVDTRKDLAALSTDDPIVETIRSLFFDMTKHHTMLRKTAGRVWFDPEKIMEPDIQIGVIEGVERLVQGRAAFTLFSGLTKAKQKDFIENITLDGGRPETKDQWLEVQGRIQGYLNIPTLIRRWQSIREEVSLPAVDIQVLGPAKSLTIATTYSRCALAMMEHIASEKNRKNTLAEIFGKNTDVDMSAARFSIKSAVALNEYKNKIEQHQAVIQKIKTSGSYGEKWACRWEDMFEHDQTSDQDVLMMAKKDTDRLSFILEARCEITALEEQCQNLKDLGAVKWAKALRVTPVNLDGSDPLIVDTWKSEWVRQVATEQSVVLGGREKMLDLLNSRREMSKQLSFAHSEIVADKSWLQMASKSTNRVRQSLQKYLGAVRKIGQGTGVRAARHRAVAQEAMTEAWQAIPCWIMPQGRVSESMPANIGQFDLVIMDEASQSGIEAMLVLMRGKKILIVGDDKQVSPSGIGRDEKTILENKTRLLGRQPHAHRMLPDQSIYDLFSEVFAGSNVMLREHFRSAEPIIEYSNREYYGGNIIPLRIPETGKRISPPLVDVLIRNGRREKDVNIEEARFITKEIQNILADPDLAGRSIGVVTLTSNDKHAIEIKRQLSEVISEAAYSERGISVGPPAQFQGKERDIMFVSMVWDSRSGGPSNRLEFQQRFNVAMSRARDRMYLVRSIPDGMARPGGLLEGVIQHFQAPFNNNQDFDDALEKCETPLERDIAKALIDRGYRVSSHVGRRGYKIDLVVEGSMGRRLAVECDGDRTSNQEAWDGAMQRQRVLERAGWRYWRIMYAHYLKEPEATIEDLINVLDSMDIRPGISTNNGGWVEHREVGKSNLDDELEDEIRPDEKDPNLWDNDFSSLRELCDSPFEEEILERLLDWGYKVKPQYGVRGYRIDFLVQDQQGKRLAIECDGDTFHGLDNFDQDAKRQAFIENTEGFQFWRCYYSDYMSNQEKTFNSLREALDNVGLKPWES